MNCCDVTGRTLNIGDFVVYKSNRNGDLCIGKVFKVDCGGVMVSVWEERTNYQTAHCPFTSSVVKIGNRVKRGSKWVNEDDTKEQQ